MTVGTAGHVDHGKSTLVEALTSIFPDRLAEERERGLTIDLGFAWFTLPNGREVSVVDVPGHERFVSNMLAGVGGIDAVLLVIAADEGVMPQTREHLDIIDLLEIDTGVVALTKSDLVDDEWVELVEEDVRDALAGSALAAAPIVPVSAQDRTGLDRLVETLDRLLARRSGRPDSGGARIPIDRVFTMPGFGTVITGTLTGGPLHVGDRPNLYPSGRGVRIRGLQSHQATIDAAQPGCRVAVNLGGANPSQTRRGDVLAVEGAVFETRRIDARLRMLPSAARALKPGEDVALHIGAAARVARLRLLEADPIPPGGSGWVQWRLDAPIAARRGDRYVIRRLSPAATIGGGRVARALARHAPRGDRAVLDALARAAAGDPASLVRDALTDGLVTLAQLARRTELDNATTEQAIADLAAAHEARTLRSYVGSVQEIERLTSHLLSALRAHHESDPGALGLRTSDLAHSLDAPADAIGELAAAAATRGLVRLEGPRIVLAGHTVELTEAERHAAPRLLARLDQGGSTPPSLSEALTATGGSRRLTAALAQDGRLVMLAPDIALSRGTYDAWLSAVHGLFDAGPTVTVREVRDALGTSRKFALALLEYLDSRAITRRVGDARLWLGEDSERD
ncbi:MAG: selenocysteine-specific translation elongation factor [Chloroflexota bacterium]|nr:selenocysteine-specific translation elongation factor [Chloroflexota bacterium]MDE2898085.1 selenocysteine-specific translation elongation factor [Chloroflexota bacterium]